MKKIESSKRLAVILGRHAFNKREYTDFEFMKHYLSTILGFSIWGTFAFLLKPLKHYPSLDILLHRVIYASISIIVACA
ncbi:hypothetical protein GCM10023231_12860 [Olivibacter ginsenosidimutans]|uniref:EamA family transporter n=1 Tax=Olivibacter ginsenosidimutans TaxID=1176537 RepID=A0ABP9AV56_9SPHI